MTEYQKECMYCKEQITMSDESGKWLPYNKDGTLHDCRNNGKAKTNQKQGQQQEQQEGPTIKQLKIWIARLEKNGIHIDINEILNPKKNQEQEQT